MSFMGGAPVAHDGDHRHIPSTLSYHESGGSTSVFFGPLPGRVTGISGEGRHDKQGRAMSGVLGSGARPECEVTSKVPQVTLAFWIIKLLATSGAGSHLLLAEHGRAHDRRNRVGFLEGGPAGKPLRLRVRVLAFGFGQLRGFETVKNTGPIVARASRSASAGVGSAPPCRSSCARSPSNG